MRDFGRTQYKDFKETAGNTTLKLAFDKKLHIWQLWGKLRENKLIWLSVSLPIVHFFGFMASYPQYTLVILGKTITFSHTL